MIMMTDDFNKAYKALSRVIKRVPMLIKRQKPTRCKWTDGMRSEHLVLIKLKLMEIVNRILLDK